MEDNAERLSLFAHPDVLGMGVTEVDGVRHLRVFVTQDTPELRAFIPSVVDGLPTIIQVSSPPISL